ncbi:Guanine nucleotide-binding protein subunit gamma [Yamadazyma tenuis]|uniref:Guanine nucleotide-binding protein subunit gamma n=1 Tax=Candida tenuis TaxID=2315449 RepID=UPI0027A44FAD|nr:Guanine nucleotide-binding protein subunit gamma [Yamadazyma tenuis]
MEDDLRSKIQQIKLQRIQELNLKLKESLLRPRVPTSEASLSIINYTLQIPDYLIPIMWSLSPEQNRFQRFQIHQNTHKSASTTSGCCVIM